MTDDSGIAAEPRLTLYDVRHHAEEVRGIVLSEVKRITETDVTKAIVVGAVVVVGLLSLAYLAGSRRRCDA